MNPISRLGRSSTAGSLTMALVYGFIAMIVLTFLLSIILAVTDMDESKLNVYTFSIHAASMLIGGFSAGRRVESKGWYYGGISGLLYSLIIVLIAFLAYDAGINSSSLLLIAITAGMGMLGGMFGVNIKK
ncbi:TIGR04086 family membrane protein [Marinicrinis lubricantis]|uniref:TIGR04086 family membrane protein n=1 Tax=Marinicrinis lubricantis TaxID=2086470 RepID=A0ABW1IUI9_9BACL